MFRLLGNHVDRFSRRISEVFNSY